RGRGDSFNHCPAGRAPPAQQKSLDFGVEMNRKSFDHVRGDDTIHCSTPSASPVSPDSRAPGGRYGRCIVWPLGLLRELGNTRGHTLSANHGGAMARRRLRFSVTPGYIVTAAILIAVVHFNSAAPMARADAPVFMSAVSRMNHGVAGKYDIPLP